MIKQLHNVMWTFLGAMGILGILAYFGLIIGFVVGYFMNIFDLIGMIGTDLSANLFEVVLRVVGVFVGPLGAIMGWFF